LIYKKSPVELERSERFRCAGLVSVREPDFLSACEGSGGLAIMLK